MYRTHTGEYLIKGRFLFLLQMHGYFASVPYYIDMSSSLLY